MSDARASHGGRLRRRMAEREILPFIGIYDVFSASIAARHFEGIFVSGFSFAASFYGLPDIGFISWSDIVAFVQRLRGILPRQHLLVDIDDGYGDAEVASHVVSLLESAGASGVVLEDQKRPRRCGHLDGKQLLELPEFLIKLERVLAARGEMVVVARTDAVEREDVLSRVEAFARAGADAVLVDAVGELSFLRELKERAGRPVVFNQLAGGKSPGARLDELARNGVSLVLYSTPCLFPAQEAVEGAMRSLRENGGSLEGIAADVDLKVCNALLHENLRDRSGPPRAGEPFELEFRQEPGVAPEWSIPRRPSGGPAPLSFAQQRLWFLEHLEPGVPVYNLPVAVRLAGDLDVEALEWSLGEVVRRHEALRTTYESAAGEPVQVIGPPAAVPLPVTDLSGIAAAGRDSAALRLAVAEAQQPFDLARGPILRAMLLRLAQREHLFLLTMHHIACDAWSIGLLFGELADFYEARRQGRSPSLPELAIQYADFAVWQRKWLTGEILDTQLSYWRRQLAGAPPLVRLPCDRPRPKAPSLRGERLAWTLPKPLTERIQTLARRERATLFMTLLAAFMALLSRYTGEEDIPVGTAIAGRNREETEGLIGFFVNTLVLRGDLSGDPTFRELLARVRETALSAYSHQDLPFERLVEELQPERSLAHTPLFQVMFLLQNASTEIRRFSDLAATPVKIDRGITSFDLSLEVTEKPEGLSCLFVFNTDLFDSSTIARLSESFETILSAIVEDPGRPLSRLPLLTREERRRLLVEWSGAGARRNEPKFVPALFEVEARRAPEATAAEMEGKRLTYGELNRRANRLARRLRALGVGPEVAVAVCLDRSLEMIVGILAILKAGGAYVPLEPATPKPRLEFLLEDSRAAALLTQERLLAKVPEGRAPIICLDRDWPSIEKEGSEDLPRLSPSESLAYVIYTSGSTGKPKGVMISHAALASFLGMASAVYSLGPDDRVLQFASISFDTSVEEIFCALTSGARLVLRSEEMLESSSLFLEKCREWGITLMSLPTAYWHGLASDLSKENLALPPSLRLLIVGGERALAERLVLWRRQAAGAVRLLNSYGPSEATVFATVCDLPGSAEPGGDAREVPIGRPAANAEIYILDRFLEPVPQGVAGELYIGGEGLARGYLNRPLLTAESFLPHPFQGEGGARLYKTGDHARFRADGMVEFLGRTDYQIKLRGFRIELSEIEAALLEHEGVREAVVLAQEEGPGEKRLIAYLVAQSGALGARELRSHLRERLPDWMIPSAFVPLASLPVTPSGKVDRLSLAPPVSALSDPEETSGPPRTPIEESMARIWTEVLGIERVGVHDNFFELGGHSLLATRVFARLKDSFHVGLPLRTLFEAPTIAELSAAIEKARDAGGVTRPDPIVPAARRVRLPRAVPDPEGPAKKANGKIRR